MYCAKISGWTEVTAYADTAEKAKRLAINGKRKQWYGPADGFKWNWEGMEEYFGAECYEIKSGLVIID